MGIEGDEIADYLHRLFPLCRSITGEPNRQTLRILQEIIPLFIKEIASGTPVLDWCIPDEWSLREAYISDDSGKRIVDFDQNNLHVVSYSVPVDGWFRWEELDKHLHFHELPNAIPYRTSYYKRDWGFCVTQEQYAELRNNSKMHRVVINSEFTKGSLSYGEHIIRGRSSREILLSCYICHPSMANDSLSGVLITALLARYLNSKPITNWSYRFVFVPETIGAIAYLSQHQEIMQEIDIGFVITTCGGEGQFGVKKSFNDHHWINDFVISTVERYCGSDIKVFPFDIHGSDERQYSTQGFGINCTTITKDKYYDYDEYHTSLDNLDLVKPHSLFETFKVYKEVIDNLESLEIFEKTNIYGESMLRKHGLHNDLGGSYLPGGEQISDLVLKVLFWTDGKTPVSYVASKVGLDLANCENIYKLLAEKNLVRKI